MTVKVQKHKILMSFHRDTDDEFVTSMGAVDDGVYGHPDRFVNPIIDKGTFDAQKLAVSTAVIAAKDGGRKAIAEKNKQRAAGTKMLSKLARYVEEIANNDLATLTLSGFPVTTGNPAPQALSPTGVDKLEQKITGQIIVTLVSVFGARMYEIRYGASGANGADPAAFTTIQVAAAKPGTPVNGLTPGTVYAFQARAFGKTGWTAWSNPITKMST